MALEPVTSTARTRRVCCAWDTRGDTRAPELDAKREPTGNSQGLRRRKKPRPEGREFVTTLRLPVTTGAVTMGLQF